MIPLFKVRMSPKAKEIVSNTLDSGFIGEGPKVLEFEKMLKDYFNNLLTLTVNSATSGLHLALHLLKQPYNVELGHHPSLQTWPGLQPGDEVLTTPLTCTATNWPILANGLNIKWVDVDPFTCNMDLKDLARKITPKTKVIMLVHWGGLPIDLDEVKRIQNEASHIIGFKPAVIEDCAHAMGSIYKGKRLGNHGNICVFSFQAIKHLTTGDGGCIIFPHQELYYRAKLLRWYGIDRETNGKDFRCEEDIPEWGFKMHMNDINASIGIANMEGLDEAVSKHNSNSIAITQGINFTRFARQETYYSHKSAEWICTLRLFDPKVRDSFLNHMRKSNIMVSRVHERNDKHSCVFKYKTLLPGVNQMVSSMICVPCGWWLSEKELNHIIDSINTWLPQ